MQALNHSSELTLLDRTSFSRVALRIATRWVGALLLTVAMLATPSATYARGSFGVFVSVAPPPLPVYVQPICPAPGYIWTPGYWAWDPSDGYYWVPGTWVVAPFVGALWTPGYWGWYNRGYVWNVGYWGPAVGFYGGINYGFGYFGVGYAGGYWSGGLFYYNRAVNNVNVQNITNVYNRTVVNNMTVVNRVSYNGGIGGTTAQPTAADRAAAGQRRDPPAAAQRQQEQSARSNRSQFASVNHGQPAVAATPKPGAFGGSGVVRASRAGGTYNAAANRTMATRGPAPRMPAGTRPAAPMPAHPNTTKSAGSARHPAPSQSRGQTGAGYRAPQSTAQHPTARSQNVPHTSTGYRNTPHPQRAPHPGPQRATSASHPRSVAHTPAAYRSSPRPQTAPRAAPQRQSESHSQSVPRPSAAYRSTPRPQGAAHRQSQSRPSRRTG